LVNAREFRRWLARQGCTFEPGKGSHLKVHLGKRSTVLPMHGKKELGRGLVESVLKQLGLKPGGSQ
jgi:mRNA interferase HicA